MASFFSDKLASPRGASCPLFSSGSHSFLSAACFALPLARLAGSSGLAVRFRMTFASPSPFSSSTSSLRIAWAYPANGAQTASPGRSAGAGILRLSGHAPAVRHRLAPPVLTTVLPRPLSTAVFVSPGACTAQVSQAKYTDLVIPSVLLLIPCLLNRLLNCPQPLIQYRLHCLSARSCSGISALIMR